MHSFRVEATGVSGLAPITGTFWQYDVEAVESSRFLVFFVFFAGRSFWETSQDFCGSEMQEMRRGVSRIERSPWFR